MEAILNSSFDWNGIRAPHVFATENDSLNGATMLLDATCSPTGPRSSPTCGPTGARRRSSGSRATDPRAVAAGGFIHLINSGAATLDATGAMTDAAGEPAMKPFWEITDGGRRRRRSRRRPGTRPTAATSAAAASQSQFVSRGGMPVTMARLNLVSGVGPVLQIAEGWTVELPKEVHDVLDAADRPDLADALVRAPDDRRAARSATSTR